MISARTKDPLLAPPQDGTVGSPPMLGKRWYVLFVASLLAFEQGWIWNTYGPIASVVGRKDVFGWDDSILAMMGNWGPISYVLSFYPTAILLDSYGLRLSAVLCTSLLLLSSTTRLFATGTTETCTMWQHIGQFLNGVAGPFCMSAGTVLSSAWFAPGQRTTATSIFVVANMAGVSASYIVGPMMVPAKTGTLEDVRRYLWLAFWMTLCSTALVLAYFPKKPVKENAPSVSSTLSRTVSFDGMKKLLRHKQFWLLAVSYGAMTGIYSGWGPLYVIIMKYLGSGVVPNPQTTGEWVGFFSNISGNVAGLCISTISDTLLKSRGVGLKRKILIAFSLMAAVLYILFSLVVVYPAWLEAIGLPGIYALCIVGGTLINSTPPLFYELAVDAVFPIAEGLTTTVLTLTNNIGGLLFLLIPSLGIKPGPWVMFATAACCLLSAGCMACSNQQFARSKVDGLEGGGVTQSVYGTAGDDRTKLLQEGGVNREQFA